ncbi:MAG TPA: hypothetical protein VFT43_08220 [Candidatus Polarisedimenticolia bacterium]|nr:hypothetical protein [Candidatus Polarisedimenticolia bacterium]
MASGTLLDMNASEDDHPGGVGHRPFLSRPQIAGSRLLVLLYVLTGAFIVATNYRPLGDTVFRVASDHLWFAATIGILLVMALGTFCLLLAMSLRHFRGGHAGRPPASWWFWVIVLLNVVGVVAYYLWVIEPDQRTLGHPGQST